MAKTKTPFFSLGAHGSVGGSLTAQKRGKLTLMREQPFPADPYSLKQAYQRWLYEDYTYLWRQQSATTQAEYRTAGVRFHLTGFQYWMKDMLTRLPDIAGMWYLDKGTLVTAIDYGRNANHGTLFGPSPVSGVIQDGLSFDGINDRIVIPKAPSLDITEDITIEFFTTYKTSAANQFLIDKWDNLPGPVQGYGIFIYPNGNIGFRFYPLGSLTIAGYDFRDDGLWHHFAMTSTPAVNGLKGYLDGAFVGQANSDYSVVSAVDLQLGMRKLASYLDGNLDHVIIYNRVLDAIEILRHSERGYPA